jgi:hypothetical protein
MVGLFRELQKSTDAGLGQKMPFMDGHWVASLQQKQLE